jgi:hypothetical protein
MAASAAFDHIVVAAKTLEVGEDHLERLLGARPQRGGRHVAMGTHNSLLKLGERSFLELIAIDPDGKAPSHPRWFALDSAEMRAALVSGPRLIHWVARCDDLESMRRACRIDPGPPHEMTRGAYTWRITIPDDGHLPGGGVVPTLIQWSNARHPADAMVDSGLRLIALSAAHPEPAVIRSALGALGLVDAPKVTFGTPARLAAMLKTPRGTVTL